MHKNGESIYSESVRQKAEENWFFVKERPNPCLEVCSYKDAITGHLMIFRRRFIKTYSSESYKHMGATIMTSLLRIQAKAERGWSNFQSPANPFYPWNIISLFSLSQWVSFNPLKGGPLKRVS